MNGTAAVIANMALIATFSCLAFVVFQDWKNERLRRNLVGWLALASVSVFLVWSFLSCAVMIRNLNRLDVTSVSEIDVGGQAIRDTGGLQQLVGGLNDCHWFLPMRGVGVGRTPFEVRLKSGKSYSFFVTNDYGRQAILVFTKTGKGLNGSRGYAASPRLLAAMKGLAPSF